MRFAVLTRQNTAYGLALLRRLETARFRPQCIGVEQLQWTARWRMARLLARRTGAANTLWHNGRIWSRLAMRKILRLDDQIDYSQFCPSVLVTKDMNTPEMVEFLCLHPLDLIVLGHSGIVREPILSLPRLGTLNAHPARLPSFRGVDVVRWTLIARQPVAATLHWVDHGVDTGQIIRISEVPVKADDTLEQVERRAVDASLDLLIWGVRQLHAGKSLSGKSQALRDGRQYHLMPPWTSWSLGRQWPQIRESLVDRERTPKEATLSEPTVE